MTTSSSEIAAYACSPLVGDNDAYRRCTIDIRNYTESVRSQTGVYLVNSNIEYPVTFKIDGEYYAVELGQKRQIPRKPVGRIAVHIAGQGLLALAPIASGATQNTWAGNKEGSFLQAFTNGIWTQYVVGASQQQQPPAYQYQPVYQPQYPASYQPQYRPVARHPAHPQGWYPQAPTATCSSIGTSDTQESWCARDGAAVAQFGSVEACRSFFVGCQAQPTPDIDPSWTQTDASSGL